MKLNLIILTFTVLFSAAGCAPEVGSEKWCKMMSEKPQGDWTGNEAGDYVKHCVFK